MDEKEKCASVSPDFGKSKRERASNTAKITELLQAPAPETVEAFTQFKNETANSSQS